MTSLRVRRAGRTTIAITTSPAVLDACDRVVFLSRDGTSVSAPHHELIDIVAEYRDLVDPHPDQQVTLTSARRRRRPRLTQEC